MDFDEALTGAVKAFGDGGVLYPGVEVGVEPAAVAFDFYFAGAVAGVAGEVDEGAMSALPCSERNSTASGRKFAATGLLIAAGVPFRVDEQEGFQTFRVWLFGLDKLRDVEGSVRRFEMTLERLP